MRNLFTTFYRTVTDPSVYTEIIFKPFRLSAFYFFSWYIIGSLVLSFLINFILLPEIIKSSHLILEEITSSYPPDLTISVNEGTLTTNPELPTPLLLTNPLPNPPLRYLLVLDNKLPAEDIAHQSTLVLVTDKAIAVRDLPPATSKSILSWDQLAPAPLTLTYKDVHEIVQKFTSTIDNLYKWRWLITPLVVTVSVLLSRLVFLFVYSIPLMFLTLILNRQVKYQTLGKICCYTIVLTDVFILCLRLIYHQSLNWLYALAFLGISTIALLSLNRQSSKIL